MKWPWPPHASAPANASRHGLTLMNGTANLLVTALRALCNCPDQAVMALGQSELAVPEISSILLKACIHTTGLDPISSHC